MSSLAPTLALAHAATSNTVLFDREIVRILDAHCVMCHMQDGPSFPLTTYEETWLMRGAIHDQTLARHMPPWAAVPGYGEFANANRLTLREQRFIVSWVEGLGPRNGGSVFLNVADAGSREEIRARADFDRWALGAPDREVELPPATRVAPSGGGPARVQRSVFDPGLSSARRIAALEYRPRRRDSIRAAVFTVEETGQWLATWTPWHGYRRLPDGAAYELATGARIVAEIHSTEGAEILAGAGRVGFHFARGTARAGVQDALLIAEDDVPPGTEAHRLQAETALTEGASVLALWPDLPSGVRTLQVSAVLPNGHVEILLYALDIPPGWPTAYIYEEQVALPAGSRLSLTAYATNASSTPERKRVELRLSIARPRLSSPIAQRN